MIFKRYKLFLENQQSKEEINSICKKYGIVEKYTINDDNTIDVDDNVNLFNMGLTKLPIKFGRVSGSFNCGRNHLTSLEGSPYYVGGYFSCNDNYLTSLEGSPKYTKGFRCRDNKLKTLEEGPKTVLLDYICSNNQLVNFKGIPEDFEGDIDFYNNPVSKLLKDIPKDKMNKFIYWCNELNVIDDEGNVTEEWLEEVYYKIGINYKLYLESNKICESIKPIYEYDLEILKEILLDLDYVNIEYITINQESHLTFSAMKESIRKWERTKTFKNYVSPTPLTDKEIEQVIIVRIVSDRYFYWKDVEETINESIHYMTNNDWKYIIEPVWDGTSLGFHFSEMKYFDNQKLDSLHIKFYY